MKRKLLCLLLALLLLTGCTPPAKEPVSGEKLDIGTTINNLTGPGSGFAMANGFVYIAAGNSILEYDMETGSAVEIPLPGPDGDLYGGISGSDAAIGLFLTEKGPVVLLRRSRSVINRDSMGRYISSMDTRLHYPALIGLDGQGVTEFPEFGEYLWNLIVIPKDEQPDAGHENDAPRSIFAGLDFYYRANYDTYPEKAAELAMDGILLPEPETNEEREKYIGRALFHLDGDTMKRTLLMKNPGTISITEDKIYVSQQDISKLDQGVITETYFCSDRRNIDFQPIDSEAVRNYYMNEDGNYYVDEGWLMRETDGVITKLPVEIGKEYYLIWRDKAVVRELVVNEYGQDVNPGHPYWIVDLNTGEKEPLCQDVEEMGALLGDRYFAYHEETREHEAYILLDLETREKIEMWRRDRTVDEIQKLKEEEERLLEFLKRIKEKQETD